MFSPEDVLRPYKRSRSNMNGADASEAPFLTSIDFSDTLDGHQDGLVFGLEDNDFVDAMLPMLLDGSPDEAARLHSSPTEPAPGAALRPPAAHRSSPPLPAPLPASMSLPVPTCQPAAPGAPPTQTAGLVRSTSVHLQVTHITASAGAFIPTPAAAVATSALPRPPSSSALVPGPGAAAGPSRPGPGCPGGAGSRAGTAGPGPAKVGLGSGASGSGFTGSPRQGAAPRSNSAAAAAAVGSKAGAGGGLGGGLSFSGLDSDEEGGGGEAPPQQQRQGVRSNDPWVSGSPGQRRSGGNATTAAAVAATTTATTCTNAAGGGGGSAAAAASLLLRAFNGAMRPDVAALAAAAAQRALITAPSVRPGLYFSEPEKGGGGGGGAAAAAAAKGASIKRGGKDRQGPAAGPAAPPTPTALPFAKYYPEADAELMAALYGKRPLPRRVRVEPISDRCHPCFRNPFEGLAGVKERKKLVATGPLPEGALLGAYTGELRSGKMDERLVGGDLSGVEGLKAAFTLTLLDDLETRASEQELVAPNAAPSRDSLVVVGDPASCPLAEANAPKFWGACASLKPGAVGVGGGERGDCNCRAYRDRANNAAVIPCVFKVRLSRLRASVEATGAGGGGGAGGSGEAAQGLEVLRAAAAAVAPAPSQPGAAAAAGAASAAPAPSVSSTSGAGRGAAGAGAGEDPDKSTYVYGIVTVVVTSTALKEGEEVLLRWDDDDSFFAVADQNLRQYLFIRGLTAERDTAEAKASEQRRQLALLRKAHREAQAARETAVQGREEAVRQKDEAERRLEEAERQRDEAVRQRDEAAEDVHSQRAASAAVAAAVGPRVRRLEEQVAQLRSERDALAARLEQLQQQPEQLHPHQQEQRHPILPHHSQQLLGHQPQQQQQLQAEQQHPEQQQQQKPRAESGSIEVLRHDCALPPLPPTDPSPQKRRRLDGELDSMAAAGAAAGSHGGGAAAAAVTTSAHVRIDDAVAEPEDVDGDPTAAAEVLRRYADAKRQHDAAAAELAAALELREGAGRRRMQRLEGELVEARRQAEEAAARLSEVQRELEASRLRATQLERQLLGATTGHGGGGGSGGSGGSH
ncbi:hypothetical protein PLESTM_001311600 [Pleodorina starrii]|nr:hypothetical protein PLESTM_001311600 [Pleodorina starrii]